MFALWKQPENKEIDSFKVPLFPFLPLAGIFINVYLLYTLSATTWYRFLVWFILGLIIYFAYGIRNSNENKKLNVQIHEKDDKKPIEGFENKIENIHYF
jgi:cationic amino acid transporter 2